MKGLALNLLKVIATLSSTIYAEEKSIMDGATVIDNGMFTQYYPGDSLISDAFAAFSHNVVNQR